MGDWIRNLLDIDPAWSEAEQRTAVNRALTLRQEVEAFERRWGPGAAADETPTPAFTWDQLERQLTDLSDCPVKSAMARDLVSATRKMSRFKPPEMILREILCMTWALLDEGFQPEPSSQPGGSAEMP